MLRCSYILFRSTLKRYSGYFNGNKCFGKKMFPAINQLACITLNVSLLFGPMVVCTCTENCELWSGLIRLMTSRAASVCVEGLADGWMWSSAGKSGVPPHTDTTTITPANTKP